MDTILQDLTSASAVVAAIEDNMIAFWTNYGRIAGNQVFEDERLIGFISGLPHPLFNAVFRAQLRLSQIEPTINEMVEKFSAKNLPAFWWVGPSTLPSDLGNHLLKQSFERGGITPGMAIALNALPEKVSVPDDFEIRFVKDMPDLRLWTDILVKANDVPELAELTWLLEASLNADFRASLRHYIGCLAGEPVTASTLYLDSGVAGIYSVATLQHARGKGLGAAITLQPLQDARAMGYKVGVLQASSMGHSVYKRLGFKDFCQFEIYMHLPQ